MSYANWHKYFNAKQKLSHYVQKYSTANEFQTFMSQIYDVGVKWLLLGTIIPKAATAETAFASNIMHGGWIASFWMDISQQSTYNVI